MLTGKQFNNEYRGKYVFIINNKQKYKKGKLKSKKCQLAFYKQDEIAYGLSEKDDHTYYRYVSVPHYAKVNAGANLFLAEQNNF